MQGPIKLSVFQNRQIAITANLQERAPATENRMITKCETKNIGAQIT